MKKRALWIIGFVWMLTACSGQQATQDNERGESAHLHQLPNGDVQEVTASVDQLPSFLDDQSDELRLVYQMAGKATDILDVMPCYCGCGDSAGHLNNKNCFVHEVREDGSVVWDDHGTRCLVCVEIAVQSVKMTQEGKSLQEIRHFIDETYAEGYAAPTPTPMPASS